MFFWGRFFEATDREVIAKIRPVQATAVRYLLEEGGGPLRGNRNEACLSLQAIGGRRLPIGDDNHMNSGRLAIGDENDCNIVPENDTLNGHHE